MEETRVLKANLSEKSPYDFLVGWVRSLACEGADGVWDVALERGEVRAEIAVFSPSWVERLKSVSLFETFKTRGIKYPNVSGTMLCYSWRAIEIDSYLACNGSAHELLDELLRREASETILTARRIDKED